MQVRQFEVEAGQTAEKPQEPRADGDGDAPAPMRASPPRENDERRNEDALEEPGYGHGV